MVITKNQIRPRRKKVHFTNAEILLLDGVQLVPLIAPESPGEALFVYFTQVRTNIVQAYGNLDAAPFFVIYDSFCAPNGAFYEDDAPSISAFTDLFTNTGINLGGAPNPYMVVDSFDETVPRSADNWTNEADLLANGGIFLFFTNGGAELDGGDPANYLDIFIDYGIINL